jgi:hypothetical protein
VLLLQMVALIHHVVELVHHVGLLHSSILL